MMIAKSYLQLVGSALGSKKMHFTRIQLFPSSFSYLIEFPRDPFLMEGGLRLLLDCPLLANSMCFMLQQAKERASAHGLPEIAISSLVLDHHYLSQLLAPVLDTYHLLDVNALFISSALTCNAFYVLLRCLSVTLPERRKKLEVFISIPCFEILRIQWLSTDFFELCTKLCNVHPINLHQAISLNNQICIKALPAGGPIGSVCWHLTSYSDFSLCHVPSFASINPMLSSTNFSLESIKDSIRSPLDMLIWEPLRNSLQATGVQQFAALQFEQSIHEIIQLTVKFIMSGSSVLFPVNLSNSVYFDFLEIFCTFLGSRGQHQKQIPICILSEMNSASCFFKLFNSMSEQFKEDLQNKAVEMSEYIFPNFSLAIASGQVFFCHLLENFESFQRQKTEIGNYGISPNNLSLGTLIFVHQSEPYFQGNEFIEYFLSQWKDPTLNNMMVLTDCQINHSELIAPYRPLKMKVASYPLDPFLLPTDSRLVLDKLNPVSWWNASKDEKTDLMMINRPITSLISENQFTKTVNEMSEYPATISERFLKEIQLDLSHFDPNSQKLTVGPLTLDIHYNNNSININ